MTPRVLTAAQHATTSASGLQTLLLIAAVVLFAATIGFDRWREHVACTLMFADLGGVLSLLITHQAFHPEAFAICAGIGAAVGVAESVRESRRMAAFRRRRYPFLPPAPGGE